MPGTLRDLLIQRAARLQDRPAFTSKEWGTLSYGEFRNRVEGVALGLMATDRPMGAPVFSATGAPWDWASEVATACCGLRWDEAGKILDIRILGGALFNDEHGRGPYHERGHDVEADTLFSRQLDHGAMMFRLQRMNRILGWDHDSVARLPESGIGSKEVRTALWCSLYAGAHAIIEDKPRVPAPSFWRKRVAQADWDPRPFSHFWE